MRGPGESAGHDDGRIIRDAERALCSARIKARMKMTETLYIFFGIHTANVVELSGRIAKLRPTAG